MTLRGAGAPAPASCCGTSARARARSPSSGCCATRRYRAIAVEAQRRTRAAHRAATPPALGVPDLRDRRGRGARRARRPAGAGRRVHRRRRHASGRARGVLRGAAARRPARRQRGRRWKPRALLSARLRRATAASCAASRSPAPSPWAACTAGARRCRSRSGWRSSHDRRGPRIAGTARRRGRSCDLVARALAEAGRRAAGASTRSRPSTARAGEPGIPAAARGARPAAPLRLRRRRRVAAAARAA